MVLGYNGHGRLETTTTPDPVGRVDLDERVVTANGATVRSPRSSRQATTPAL
jgi:hypothetical protein